MMHLTHARTLASVGLAAVVALTYAAPAPAQDAPPLGTAGDYAVLATDDNPVSADMNVTCTTSTIDGDVGSTGNMITDTGPCTITGVTDAPVDAGVVSDFDDAYTALDDDIEYPCGGTMPLGSDTLAPGVYCSLAGTTYGAGVTITLDGDADDVWIFRIGTGGTGALTGTGPTFEVVMAGTAQACNVYWWTAEAVTMTDALFAGTVLAGTSATMTDTTWEGRALATVDVTLTDSEITGCPAGVAPPEPPTLQGIPTLGPGTMAVLIALLAGMGLLVLRRSFL